MNQLVNVSFFLAKQYIEIFDFLLKGQDVLLEFALVRGLSNAFNLKKTELDQQLPKY